MTKLPPSQITCLASERDHPLRYVERKRVNHSFVQELLQLSADANQWSNFGPVCARLEDKLAQVLALPEHLEVIACSNATVALHTLVGMHNFLSERPLRWVTSAFGFYASCDGILRTAEIVDCDQNGMLDLDTLEPGTFDGFVVTNMFGRYKELAKYQQYASQHDKIMVVDGAMAFHAGGHIANTCISMHHTKPWGFGEGGCAIVEKQHAQLYREMLAFGHVSPNDEINRWATNGKISDVACAYLLMRLNELPQIYINYQEQYQRLSAIGARLGLPVLGGGGPHPGAPANVPFLYPTEISLEADPKVPAHKYYHPLSNLPNAVNIFKRIINIACHAEMASLSDEKIESFLSQKLARC